MIKPFSFRDILAGLEGELDKIEMGWWELLDPSTRFFIVLLILFMAIGIPLNVLILLVAIFKALVDIFKHIFNCWDHSVETQLGCRAKEIDFFVLTLLTGYKEAQSTELILSVDQYDNHGSDNVTVKSNQD